MQHVKITSFVDIEKTAYWLHNVPHWLASAPEGQKAAETFNKCYQFGGWQPIEGARIVDKETGAYVYPGDPVMKPFARLEVDGSDEVVFAYPHELWGIMQKDGSFEVARMD